MLRQRVTATAIVYFRRFFVRCAHAQCDDARTGSISPPRRASRAATRSRTSIPPSWRRPACTWPPKLRSAPFACATSWKRCVARSPVRPRGAAAHLRADGRGVGADYCYAKTRPYTPRLLFQCEFVVLDALNFDLIVFHPYRPLQQCVRRRAAAASPTTTPRPLTPALRRSADTLPTPACRTRCCVLRGARLRAEQPATRCFASRAVADAVNRPRAHHRAVVNDSYCTDVHLTHPPFVIALAALSLAAIKEGYDIQHWFAALNVNPVEVHSGTAPASPRAPPRPPVPAGRRGPRGHRPLLRHAGGAHP